MAPSSSPSPSKKLLISGPKPKSHPNSASSSSTTTTPPPPEKRTRDQPNLSDCHCCGRRINHTNPKDRLQPLDSVWRIVLLCRKCRKSVHSGQTCPYCFLETGNSGDLFKCRACERRIHKDCVRDYGNCKPWSYLGMGLEGFRVCVDCWVPELLKNSIRVIGRSENKGGLKDKGEGKDLLGNVVQDAKCGAEKKVKKAVKAKEQVLRRAKGTIDAVDLAGGVSDLLAKEDGCPNCSGAVEVVDDADLAIQLHRVINSSPRILRGKSSVNSDSLDVLNIRNWKGLSYKRSGLGKNCSEDQKLGTCANSAENKRMNQPAENGSSVVISGLSLGLLSYKRDRKRKIWQLDEGNTVVSEPMSSHKAELKNLPSDDARTRCSMKGGADMSVDSICVNTDKRNGDRSGQEIVSYMRTRFKQKVCQVSGMLGVSGDSSSCDSHRVAFKSDYSQPDNANISTDSLVKSDSQVILPSGSWDREQDRYHLKYVKRITGIKPDSSFLRYGPFPSLDQISAPAASNSEAGYSVNNDELILPNGTCNQDTDRCSLKYAKRVKRSKSGSNSENELHADAFLTKVEISATGLTMNCSAESRTPSDVSFDSFTIDLTK